jgi:type I restriction enzyme S subunit
MSAKWPKVRLGEVLKPVSRSEAVDSSKEYKLIGVRLDGKGAFLREVVSGAETSAKTLYRIATADFIYSRLFAWRGAFDVVRNDLDGCYVSGEFPTFIAQDKRLDSYFLNYWFRLPETLDRVKEHCSGSTPLTRNRFKEQFFLELEIPLPPLAEQQRIVARIEELAGQIGKARVLIVASESDSNALLSAVFINLIRDAQCLPMNKIAPIVRRPAEVKHKMVYPELGVRFFGNGTFHKPALPGTEVGSKKLYQIEPDDLLFNNVFAWEGAVAVAKPEDAGRFGSHRFIACVPKKGLVTAQFLRFYFLTVEGLHKLGDASPGGAGRNRTLGLDALSKIEVPVPEYRKQLWFDRLQDAIKNIKHAHDENIAQLDALLLSILDKTFKREMP